MSAPAVDAPPVQAGRVRSGAWLLGGIVALGLGLRLVGLGEGLWYDEIAALVNYVRRPLGQIVTTFDSQNQHLLYSILARLSVVTFGESAWALRLPAALFGALSLWAAYLFGRRVTSEREALCAALLLALSYHHVWFSQNARGYSALLAGTLLSTAWLLPLLRGEPDRPRRYIAGWAVVSALTLYTNLAALFVMIAQGLVWLGLLLGRRLSAAARRQTLVAFAAGAAITLLLYAPVLGEVVRTTTRPTMGGSSVEWKHPLWLLAETVRVMGQGVPGGFVALAAGALVTVVGLASYARRAPVAASLMTLPVLVTAAAMVATSHNLWPRLFFFAAGFAVLIVVRGVFAIAERSWPRRGTAIATAGCVLAALASATTVPAAWNPKQDHEGARDWVAAHRRPGDAVVAVDMARFPLNQWLRAGYAEAANVDELRAIEAGAARTLVLYEFPARLRALQPALLARLEQEYREAARFPGTVGGGTVVVMERP